jgi:hypothetical protein
MQHLKTIEDVESFFLKHGENIVDLIGGEVDRIEKQLKVSVSQINFNQSQRFNYFFLF